MCEAPAVTASSRIISSSASGRKRAPQIENAVPPRNAAVEFDDVSDDFGADGEVRFFSQKHFLVLQYERHRQVNLETLGTDELQKMAHARLAHDCSPLCVV